MALRKLLYMDQVEGFQTEMNPLVDEIQFGKLTLNGLIGVGIDGGGNTAVNFADPAGSQDLTTKAYVDAQAQGLDPKGSVRALATTSQAITGLPSSIDGVTTWSVGQRVNLTAQATASQNGIWEVQAGAWVRPADFDTGSGVAGSFTFVEEGTIYANSGWVCSTNQPNDIVDTDSLAWVQFSGAGQVVAGGGLIKTGNQLDVDVGDGIAIVTNRVTVDLAVNPALALNGVTPAAGLEWLPDINRGLNKDGSGAFIDLAVTPGLQFTGGKLDTFLNASGGLQKSGTGLALKIDNTPATLQVDAVGLRVIGLPSLFNINGTAVSAGVSAANLDTLTNGSVADSLHTHIGLQADRLEEIIIATATVASGDPVTRSATSNQIDKADSAGNVSARVMGIAEGAISIGTSGTIVRQGPAIGVISGATPGDPFYLQSGGGVAANLPGSGQRIVRMGYAINATDLDVIVHDFGKKA